MRATCFFIFVINQIKGSKKEKKSHPARLDIPIGKSSELTSKTETSEICRLMILASIWPKWPLSGFSNHASHGDAEGMRQGQEVGKGGSTESRPWDLICVRARSRRGRGESGPKRHVLDASAAPLWFWLAPPPLAAAWAPRGVRIGTRAERTRTRGECTGSERVGTSLRPARSPPPAQPQRRALCARRRRALGSAGPPRLAAAVQPATRGACL